MRRDRWGKVVIEPGDWVTFAPKVTQAAIDALGLSSRVIQKLLNKRIIVSDKETRYLLEDDVIERVEARKVAKEKATETGSIVLETLPTQKKTDCWKLWDLDNSTSCGSIPEQMIVPVSEPGEKVLLAQDD